MARAKQNCCAKQCADECGDLLIRLIALLYLATWAGAFVLTVFGATDITNGKRVVGVAKLAAAGALVFLGISPCLVYCGWEPHKAPCSTDVDPRDGRAAHCCLFRRAVAAERAKYTPGFVAVLGMLLGLALLFLLKEAAGDVPKKGFLAVLAVALPLVVFFGSLLTKKAPWYNCWFSCCSACPANVEPEGWAHSGCCDEQKAKPSSASAGAGAGAPGSITGAPKDGPLAEPTGHTANPLRIAVMSNSSHAGAMSPGPRSPGMELAHVPSPSSSPHAQPLPHASAMPATSAWYPQMQGTAPALPPGAYPNPYSGSGSYPAAQQPMYGQPGQMPPHMSPTGYPAGYPAGYPMAYTQPGVAYGQPPPVKHAL